MTGSEKIKKVGYKIEDRMLFGSVYDHFMLKLKYDTPPLSFLYNVMIGQKHRMLYYKRLKKIFWKECTKNPYWEKNEKIANKDTVWFCWLQGINEAPEVVKRCLESIRRNMKDKNIIILDQNNIFDYIELPDYIMEKWRAGIIGNAHFSDLIRLELLIRHGGLWIDATVFCTDTKLLEYIKDQPIFMFSFYYFGFNPEIMMANNWMLYGTSNQNIYCLTREFLYQYWRKYNRAVNYFIFQLFMTMAIEYYKAEFDKMPIVSQVDAHILSTYIFDSYDSNKYELLKSQTGIHKLSTRFDQESIKQKDTFYDRIIRRGEY
ncbi:capsular polysaccharide synthesis protein [Anaeromicropila herbilytica]|uniref:Capsular polysaccharide biosynthesis protein n=1 Tax=Anaeromicropila herbilytica TaxID=2785025 RepID=A0A7R7EHU9_9FIRM|nr:capsular polysaccharide synthesis protein [Anaeromicropila herbilytica]BCN29019.1 capsular polysaccharide biosynthesis protein [Anaeromicropila herbilytica]